MGNELTEARKNLPSIKSLYDQFLTVKVENQWLAVSIETIADIIKYHEINPIPLAPKFVYGCFNLNDSVVTAIDVRPYSKLNIKENTADKMFVIIKHGIDLYSITVDEVGETESFLNKNLNKNHSEIPQKWQNISKEFFHSEQEKILILNISDILNS